MGLAHTSLWLAHAWFIEIDSVRDVCACVFTSKAINN